jgi:hypothetical protein
MAASTDLGVASNRAKPVVSKELRGDPRVAEFLLHDRPGRVPKPMRVQLRDAMGDAKPRAHVLGSPDRQALPPRRPWW